MKHTKRLHEDEDTRERQTIALRFVNFLLALTILGVLYVRLVNSLQGSNIPLFGQLLFIIPAAIMLFLVVDLFSG